METVVFSLGKNYYQRNSTINPALIQNAWLELLVVDQINIKKET